jgi:hypothetical protein
MQHEQYQPHNQYNVNESRGHVKCEISQQPKNDQNRGNYSEHVFISLIPKDGQRRLTMPNVAVREKSAQPPD